MTGRADGGRQKWIEGRHISNVFVSNFEYV